jgi:fumarate hydratase subunit beta
MAFVLEGQNHFYSGPTAASAGRPLGSIGPTTASRMDFAAPSLYSAGIVATIGKGSRSQDVARACRETGSVYLAAVGGSAALLAKCVVDAQTIAWDDLGTEALRRLELVDFPCFVAFDTMGGDIYAR